MFLNKFSVLNLYGKDELSIDFKHRVTFLTGINGSGKSTLLNVIFDSLIRDPEKFGKPSTSKNRFWASKAEFDDGVTVESLVIPFVSNDSTVRKSISESLNRDLYSRDTLNEVKAEFNSTASFHHLTYLNLADKHTGELWGKKWLRKGDGVELFIPQDEKPVGFLFQEDRQTIHNLENSSYDPENAYWNIYKNSIDERFSYIRDVIQIRESHLNNRIVKEISRINEGSNSFDLEKYMNSKEIREVSDELEEISEVEERLTKYLEASNKVIVRDDDNKITLGYKPTNDEDDPEAISWNLLSRGEKTLLYLFFSVYFYKDRTSIFLLDEPEISFHVKWQSTLIQDLSEIAKNNQFIVATHSPSLIMNGWMDNCLELRI